MVISDVHKETLGRNHLLKAYAWSCFPSLNAFNFVQIGRTVATAMRSGLIPSCCIQAMHLNAWSGLPLDAYPDIKAVHDTAFLSLVL
uniref:Uncharacterized protein n=1 Tax=Arundo donax TaxID=35708 RepID=A0A0A9U510_ARUDO